MRRFVIENFIMNPLSLVGRGFFVCVGHDTNLTG